MLNSAAGGDVSDLEIGTSHQHDLGDTPGDIGRSIEGSGDIRQRADWNQRDGTRRFASQHVDDEIDPMPVLKAHRRVGKPRPVQTGLSMYMLGGHQLAAHRCVAPRKDGDFSLPGQFADDAGILLRQLQGNVARHRDDPQNIQFLGRGQSQQDSNRVVLAGVRVYDDLAALHVVSLRSRDHGETDDPCPDDALRLALNTRSAARRAALV